MQHALIFFAFLLIIPFVLCLEQVIRENSETADVEADCKINPCSCCAKDVELIAAKYSSSCTNEKCQLFAKNLFCVMACIPESHKVITKENDSVLVSTCSSSCDDLYKVCGGSKSSDSVNSDTSEDLLDDEQKLSHRTSVGISDSGDVSDNERKSVKNDTCTDVAIPSMPTANGSHVTVALKKYDKAHEICIDRNGLLSFNGAEKLGSGVPLLLSDDTSYNPVVPRSTDSQLKNVGLTIEEMQCGFCFTVCCCWPVWSGTLLAFVCYVAAALCTIFWQASLFSSGIKSKHFWKGGGAWLASSGGSGLLVGLLIGGFVSRCAAGAFMLGGSLMCLLMSLVMVGRIGALMGSIGGMGCGVVIGVLTETGTLGSILGLLFGLLLGIVVGFAPIARSLRMNDRYIRRGIRLRDVRRRSSAAAHEADSDFLSDRSVVEPTVEQRA